MIFALLGGDGRSAQLRGLLREAGHGVRCFALEEASPAPGICNAPCLGVCCAGADCVVLPMPVSTAEGLLFAPLSREKCPIEQLFSTLPEGCLLCGGRISEDVARLAARRGLALRDYFTGEPMAVGNAALTAEGALALLLRETSHSLLGSRALVLGFGRIGKLLSLRLAALGARVTVAARSPEARAWSRALGLEALDITRLGPELGDFEVIVNTVPAPVLPEALLRHTGPEVLLLELASAPGGIDLAAAKALGRRARRALGLPGEIAPKSAAALIRERIFAIMEEHHGKA